MPLPACRLVFLTEHAGRVSYGLVLSDELPFVELLGLFRVVVVVAPSVLEICADVEPLDVWMQMTWRYVFNSPPSTGVHKFMKSTKVKRGWCTLCAAST